MVAELALLLATMNKSIFAPSLALVLASNCLDNS